MLAAVSFPIYLQALFNAFVGKEQKWHVTGSRNRPESPFNFIIPQVLAFVFLLVTSAVAVWQMQRQGVVTLGAAWNITNTLILGVFMVVAWRESRGRRRPVRTTSDSADDAHGPSTDTHHETAHHDTTHDDTMEAIA